MKQLSGSSTGEKKNYHLIDTRPIISFEVIQKILDGETVQKETIVPDQVITKENVDESESLVF